MAQATTYPTEKETAIMNIHEMTLPQYIGSMKGQKVEHDYFTRKGQLIHNHRNAVIHALQLGWNVSETVVSSLGYPLPHNFAQ